MTKEEILEYNKLCAEFLYPNVKEEYESGKISIEDGVFKKAMLIFEHFDLMKFHSDWNWIHEVIEAIEKLKYIVQIKTSPTTSEKWTLHTIIIQKNTINALWNNKFIIKYESDYSNNESKKEAVVEAIYLFLKWYNEQRNTNKTF